MGTVGCNTASPLLRACGAVTGGGAAGKGAAVREVPRLRIQLGRPTGALLPSEGGWQGDAKYELSAVDAAIGEVRISYPKSSLRSCPEVVPRTPTLLLPPLYPSSRVSSWRRWYWCVIAVFHWVGATILLCSQHNGHWCMDRVLCGVAFMLSPACEE